MPNPYIPLKTQQLNAYVTDAPSGVILNANESFISLPENLRQGAAEVVARALFNRYPDPYATKLCQVYGDLIGVDPAYLTAGNGADELILIAVGAFAEAGDTVLTIAPDFSMYKFYSEVAGVNCVELGKGPAFDIDVDLVISKIKESRPKILAFSNPCNPTAQGLPRGDVLRVREAMDGVGILLLDEAYMDFWDQPLLCAAHEYDNLIVLKTCSKNFGLAAVRLGFSAANAELTGAMKKVKSVYNLSHVSQEIGAYILKQKEYLNDCTRDIIKSRDELHGLLTAMAGRNEGVAVLGTNTNFVTLSLPGARDAYEALKKRGVYIRCFADGWLRVTAGTAEENAVVVRELEAWLRG